MLISTRGDNPENEKARPCDQHGEPRKTVVSPSSVPSKTSSGNASSVPVRDELTRMGVFDWSPIYSGGTISGHATLIFGAGLVIYGVAVSLPLRYCAWPSRPRISGKGTIKHVSGHGVLTDPVIGFTTDDVRERVDAVVCRLVERLIAQQRAEAQR